jgi:hypothetical protein
MALNESLKAVVPAVNQMNHTVGGLYVGDENIGEHKSQVKRNWILNACSIQNPISKLKLLTSDF